MTDWIYHPKQNPPKINVMVRIVGSDWAGKWYGMAMRKDYKARPPGKPKGAYRTGWRWVDADGERLDDQHIEAWAPIENDH